MDIHDTITRSLWSIQTWRAHEHDDILDAGHDLDNLIRDLNRDTMRGGPGAPTSTIKHFNILTRVGLAEIAKSRTGETATTNSHHAIGSGVTPEDLDDTVLQTELARKAILSRQTVGTTERYASAFAPADIANPPQNITEAGIFTAAAGGVLIARVTLPPTVLGPGKIITVSTSVTHENGVAA